MRLLLFLAVAPAVLLIYLIYKQDKLEKEPIGLLLGLVGLGAVSTIPAVIIELVGELIINEVLFLEGTLFGNFLMYFFVVALTEELGKFFFLWIMTWKHKAFNYRFDAVIYAACVSGGFAILENILYVFAGGVGLALVRALTAIPCHIVCAVYMGHFYGQAKYYKKQGIPGRSAWAMLMSLVVPVLFHGFYDFSLTSENIALIIFVLLFVVVVDIVTIIMTRKYAREDVAVVDIPDPAMMPPMGGVAGPTGYFDQTAYPGGQQTQYMNTGSQETQYMNMGEQPTQYLNIGGQQTQYMNTGSQPTQYMNAGTQPTYAGSEPTYVIGSEPTTILGMEQPQNNENTQSY